jgi:ATP-dependent helicase/nuclease subunit A
VRGAWLALGGTACIGDPIDLEASERVFELLGEHEVGADVPDWAMFMEALGALRAEAEPDPSTRVHIMTLHRAKGLEFDVVIMPGLTRPQRRGDPQLLLWRRRSHGLLLAPMKSRYVAQGDDDPVYSYLRRLAAAEEQAELGRLLYVGCTRAKERLHLTSTLEPEEGEGAPETWKKPSSGTALGTLWPAISTFVSAPPQSSRAKANGEITGVPLLRLPAHWRLPSPPRSIPLGQPGAVDSLSDRDPVEFDWARETARRVGIVAHRLLRRLAEEGLEGWIALRIAGERRRIARELSALGLSAIEVDSAVAQVLAAIATTIADPRGRWLFDSGHAEAFSEHALTGLVDGKLLHLVLDRTFIAPDGVRWIVDFKLSRHEGADVEAFLDREQERYRTQLQDYAVVMRAIDARPIRVGLYFPLIPGWREWSPVFQGTPLSA